MEKRELGKSGLRAAPRAFGDNVFGWTVGDGMAFTLLDAFVNAGFNLIDTADIYSPAGDYPRLHRRASTPSLPVHCVQK